MEATVRRVITGIDQNGASCVVHDDTVPRAVSLHVAVTNLWSAGPAPIDNRQPDSRFSAPWSVLHQLPSLR